MDLSSFLPGGATAALMEELIANSSIEIEADESTCTYVQAGSLSAAYQRFNSSVSGNTSEAVGFAFGAIALAGLAAYAIKKNRRKRYETEPALKRSIFGLDMA